MTYKRHCGLESLPQSFAEFLVFRLGWAVHARRSPRLARKRRPLEVAKQDAFHRSEVRSENKKWLLNFELT